MRLAKHMAMKSAAVRSASRGFSTQQGDWSGMGLQYASNRVAFQDQYAIDCFERTFTGPAPHRILDVGCGTGDFTAELKRRFDCEVVGVDISGDMIRHAREMHHTKGIRFETVNLSTERLDGPFDLATSFMMLHWPSVDARLKLLTAVREMLTPGGLFCAGFHGEGSCEEGVVAVETALGEVDPSLNLRELPSMFRRDSKDAWADILASAGFSQIDVRRLEIKTNYDSVENCRKRLAAGWPPILTPYLSLSEVNGLIQRAAEIMCQHPGGPVMTSYVLEVVARA